jgi:hypothetical protein
MRYQPKLWFVFASLSFGNAYSYAQNNSLKQLVEINKIHDG